MTLVELMVVVTMIGILSALAIMGISNYSGRVKSHEAIRVVAAIKVAQEAYRAQHGECYSVAGGNLTECYPYGDTDRLGDELRAWDRGLAGARWDTLGVDVSGNVHFCYAVSAGHPGDDIPQPEADADYPTPVPTGPWYIVSATGDPDNDGRTTVYVSSSFGDSVDHIQEDGRPLH